MILFWQNHRLGQKPEFVFDDKSVETTAESKNAELFDAKASKSEFLKWASEHQKDPSELEMAADEWMEDRYGPETTYRAAISEGMEGVSKKLIDEAVERYKKDEFESMKIEFKKSLINRNSDYEKAFEKAKKASRGHREELKKSISKETNVTETFDELKQAITNQEDKGKIEKALLDGYIPALNEKYLNLDWQEKILKKNEFIQYKTLAESFKDNARENAKGRLEAVFKRFEETKNAETLKSDLETIQNDITATYKALANPEGFINLDQLKATAKKASECVNFARNLRDTVNKEEMLKIMDARDFFARKESITASKEMGERISRKAERDGAETNFIKAVQLHTQKSVANFEDARIVFSQELENETQKSFRKGFGLAEKVGQDTFSGLDGLNGLEEAKGMESQSPEFKAIVDRERTNFIIGRFQLENVDDIRLQAFMRLNTRDEREAALANPTESAALFQSIANIKAREQGPEGDEWRGQLPKKTDIIRVTNNINRPTAHELVARHMAVVGLAKEADYMIKNLATTEAMKKMGVEGRYKAVVDSPNPNPPPTDYKFKDTFRRSKARYVSEVERAGFNRRDIGFALLQTWGVITFLLNAKNAWSGWKDIPKMLEKMAKNPFIYISGTAVLGPHAAKKDPESLSYLTQSKGGQERITQHWKLNSISEHVGYTSLKNYIENGKEAAAMENLIKNDKGNTNDRERPKLKIALENAEKRPGKPVLEKEDLVGVIDENAIKKLQDTPDKSQQRIRYLFYKKFLTDPKVNLEQLKKNCRNWQG